MKTETTKTQKNKEISYLVFGNKQYIRINHVDKKIIEWKNSKTNHFVNAKKFTILENKLKEMKLSSGQPNLPDAKSISFPFPVITLSINQRHEIDKEIIRFCKLGDRLGAVKYYKDKTNLGLKESKDYVDVLYAKVFADSVNNKALDQEILRLCEAGTKLAAVKYHKEHTGLGLKESKDYVEELHADYIAKKKWDKALEPTNSEKKKAEEINKRFHTENARLMFINRVREVAKSDGPLSAVKMIKDESDWSLLDSKIFYDYNVKL